MAGGKSEEFELEEGFEESSTNSTESDADDGPTKATVVKNSLIKRRVIDELLEERKLQRRLRDFDYDIDDE